MNLILLCDGHLVVVSLLFYILLAPKISIRKTLVFKLDNSFLIPPGLSLCGINESGLSGVNDTAEFFCICKFLREIETICESTVRQRLNNGLKRKKRGSKFV